MKRKLIALFVLLGSVGMAQALTEEIIKQLKNGDLIEEVIKKWEPSSSSENYTLGWFEEKFNNLPGLSSFPLLQNNAEDIAGYYQPMYTVETDDISTYPDTITAADVAAPQPKKTKLVLKS